MDSHILEKIGLIIAFLALVVAFYNMFNILYEKHLIRREEKELQYLKEIKDQYLNI